ncbi:30S ribosomal protein S4 [Candidatus Woesebacteria bacterium RIFCSPHIGHO2_01_FULL_44_10]|uniref:Small ribosomal subunit protein uS4 n=1 Tax=Candidatus Woesebacteria bacterium RIFCSPLOWO2_01_FULL_44_14 TaxID=1802525 RepID=A0A1F8C1G1_9BACT|nr:MAG: 30S ribosomal protein S4 [Candidatus Woesebacteria bacterium RIFCSPHIGHO2_01_FULL_44_10]OGM54724.1 MAG: 30S ribosomal protein S4 [Candidatus Woesebacteria bacterium RIFCSPHIGHO2_12_FULL_44_11]OGM70194.1 MAG: 30S ribosomal protein S4 [Candidatus Woesebacteria bacterium RIFCSPLOWO2_01_FULL_44_14]
MGRYTGAKDKLSRREGVDLFGKGSKLTRVNIPPGVHGPKGTRKPSQYGRQLREKQKVKRMYGVYERQFRGYINEALKSKENTINALLSLLERRLDNVVYRLGFTNTRTQARQLVSHRHVYINGQKVNIPSYQVRVGETVTLAAKVSPKTNDVKPPAWLARKAIVGKINRLPTMDDVTEPISAQDIIEFYSR